MTDCIIVDIDGTLADTRHRLHHLAGTPKNWKGFYDAMGDDTPYQYVVDLVRLLDSKCYIALVSGRPEDYRAQTEKWCTKHDVPFDGLFMRKKNDFRPDTIAKKEILEIMRGNDLIPLFAIDDRPEVVKMWRDNNVPCLQVDASPWYAPIKDNGNVLEWLAWMKSQHHEPMYDKVATEIQSLQDRVAELEIRLFGVKQ